MAGIVLLPGVDRSTNAARAITNIIGNCAAMIMVAAWEKALEGQAVRVLEQ